MITEKTRSLALWLTDIPNRYYRYPFVKVFFRPLYYTPITPNQVSLLHIFVGLVAAWFLSQGTREGLLWSFFLFEFRALLDCFDGVLARWKNMSSIFGRHMDEISDVISSIGMLIGSGIYFYRTDVSHSFVWMIVGLGFTLIVMGNVYDFYRRKIVSILATGEDQFVNDLGLAQEKLKQFPSLFNRIGFQLDLLRCRVFTPVLFKQFNSGVLSLTEENKKILQYAEKNPIKTRTMLQVCSMSSGDIGLFILHLGLLTGALYEFYQIALVLGWGFIVFSLILVYRFFHEVSHTPTYD